MRTAVCNELFGDLSLEESCRLTAAHGFDGIEIAPFTLAPDPTELSGERIGEIRKVIEGAGLRCAGLHWLLAAPAGLHVTTDDDRVRGRSWDALKRLAGLCAGLGAGVMVFGSPKQRSGEGIPADAARARLIEGLRALAPSLEQARVKLLVEALSPEQTNVVNTMAEARNVIEAVGSPWVRGMFDFHNAREEKDPPARLLERGFDLVEHVHLNNLKGSYPTEATPEYRDAFGVLKRRGYKGWVSLEIFHFDEPPQRVLETTIKTLRALGL